MAEPIDFEGSTHYLGKPKDMSDAECGGLPVMVVKDDRGHVTQTSVFKLSEKEKEQIAKHGLLIVTVHGSSHPPISIVPYDDPDL